MPSNAQPYLWNSLLERLVGFRLYSVQFVMDYVQLRFDGPTRDEPVLHCDVIPVVEAPDGRAAPGTVGYADALVALIPGHVVSTAEAKGRGLCLELEGGALVIRPELDEVVSAEIAMLSGFEDRHWMCWRPGEEAFEYLA